VTRSKAAAGRQNGMLSGRPEHDIWMEESLARCFASSREASSLLGQSPIISSIAILNMLLQGTK
jgi:hypothetical protein